MSQIEAHPDQIDDAGDLTAGAFAPGVGAGASAPKRSLSSLALRGSVWTTAGYGASQAIRLGSNLILTRLLFPEAFGLMSLVMVFIQGVQMFSDVGIGPSVIQNKRGNDAAFLNTAWTIQVVRGMALWIIVCAGAFPFAWLYGEPQLAWLIPIVGATAIISGFNSTKIFTANRRLSLGRLTMLDLGSQIVAITVMVTWALIHPTVWALAAGAITGSLVRMGASHLILEGERNRIHWDGDAARAMFRFGRWIFLSTILTFFAMQIDRLLLGKLVTIDRLGIYAIALMMYRILPDLASAINTKVLFPSFAHLVRDQPDRLHPPLRRARIALIVPAFAAATVIAFFGELIITLLYDARYADAGPMLAILAVGIFPAIVTMTYNSVLFAMGKTFWTMAMLVVQLVFQVSAMLIGHRLGGEIGFVIGIASVGWLTYPFFAIVMRRLGLWQPSIDLPALLIGAAVAAIVFL